jgi:hypothetical protein
MLHPEPLGFKNLLVQRFPFSLAQPLNGTGFECAPFCTAQVGEDTKDQGTMGPDLELSVLDKWLIVHL